MVILIVPEGRKSRNGDRSQTAVASTTSMEFGFKDCVGSGSTFPFTKLLGRDPLCVTQKLRL
jgi:hypothetical protein